MNIKDFVNNKKLFLKYCTMIFVSLFITIIFSSAVINKTSSFAEEQIKENGNVGDEKQGAFRICV